MPEESRKKTVAENIYFLRFSLKYYSKVNARLAVFVLSRIVNIKIHKSIQKPIFTFTPDSLDKHRSCMYCNARFHHHRQSCS